MGSPDPHPDETLEESSENENTNWSDHPEKQLTDQGGGLPLSRRTTLASLAGIGGLGLANTAAAAQRAKEWQRDQDADGHKLFDLGTLAMQANETEIASFEGDGLAIDGNGVLNVTVGDTRTNVSDDGGDTVEDVEDIDFRSNLAVTDDSDGSVSVDADTWDTTVDAGGTSLTDLGALAMIDDPIIATTDGSPLELHLNGKRALRLGPTPARSAANVLAGHPSNAVSDVEGATISGGGFAESGGASRPNEVLADFGTVSGGRANTVRSSHATIGGGRSNSANDRFAAVAGGIDNVAGGENATVAGGEKNEATADDTTVGGGSRNEATAEVATIGGGAGNNASNLEATVGGGAGNNATGARSTVGGGLGNEASGSAAMVGGGLGNEADGRNSTVAGGRSNEASGDEATVPGGSNNRADGAHSFAAGRSADTNGNDGAFVWGDSSDTAATALNDDEVVFQAPGGFVIAGGLPAGSDHNAHIDSTTGQLLDADASSARYKTNIEPLETDTTAVLDLEPRTFDYEGTGNSDVGFIAEKVDETFPHVVLYDETGRPDGVKYDRLGVYLVPEVRKNRDRVTEVERAIENYETRIVKLETELAEKDDRMDDLAAELEAKNTHITDLEVENEQVRERLTAVEDRLADLEANKPSPASADD